MAVEFSERLKKLPPYIFVQIDELKKEAIAGGADIINFGIGDPDLPTPEPIIEALCESARNPSNHQYPDGAGLGVMREAVADYYQRRFNVKLNPASEVTTLIGSKEGVGHMGLAMVDEGETVRYPDPGYPVYHTGTIFAGGKSAPFYLNEANNYLPDLSELDPKELDDTKLLWVNYPHSPTGAIAPVSYYEKLIELANKHDFYICSDAAYIDIYYDGKKPPSILEVPGAMERCIEFYSCSKSFNMTGWRLAFAVGNAELITALKKFKSNIDSGQFNAVQYAGIAAFKDAEKYIETNNEIYQRRRDLLVAGLNELGWNVKAPPATFYVWVKTRGGLDSMAMTKKLINEAHIVTTPGVGLGEKSDDFIRFTLTTTEDRIKEAIERLKKVEF